MDGETRTSRVVGSVDFVRPTLPTASGDVLGEDQLVSISGVKHHMPFTIKCASADGRITTKQLEAISDEVFAIVDSKLNNYNPSSEISAVNSLPVDSAHAMSKPLQEVVICAKELVKSTRGAFDPSIAPLLKHYKVLATGSVSDKHETAIPHNDESNGRDETFDISTLQRQRGIIEHWKGLATLGFADDPSDSRVSKNVRRLMQLCQWGVAFSVGERSDQGQWKSLRLSAHKANAIRMKLADASGKNRSNSLIAKENLRYDIRKKLDDAELDLNGIAKGWTVDEIARRLSDVAVSNSISPCCYVEWGGDVKVLGKHPGGRPWIVAVPEPPTLNELRRRIETAKEAGQTGPVFVISEFYSAGENKSLIESDDKEPTKYLAVLELGDGDAVATSGDHETIVERNGKIYSHILNPHKGRLLELNDVTLALAVVVAKLVQCSSYPNFILLGKTSH